MNKEKLISLGVSENLIDGILKAYKESIDGNYVPKATFDSEREAVKTLNTQINERDTQIKELGAFKGTAEELQTKVTELTQKNEVAAKEFGAQLSKAHKEMAIKLEILSQVVDCDDVLPKLDFEKIEIKDGKINKGLTEQLETLKQSKPHYFVADKNNGTTPAFNLFGQQPKDGLKVDSQSTGSDFGKELANMALSGATSNSDVYFK